VSGGPSPGATAGAPALLTRTAVLGLMDRHGLAPHRTLGQNFVVDPNTIRRIVRLAGVGPGDRVLEIGPGLGSLTLGLVEAGAEVDCLEIDERLAPAFTEVVGDRARLHLGDANAVDLAPLVGPGPATVVANLPYNVATAIVLRVLDEVPAVRSLLVMVQREVAERLAAGPGGSARGIPSVRVEHWAVARVVGTVVPEVFHPKPRVTSALVRVDRRPEVPPVDLAELRSVLAAGFGQRRKTLRRALAGIRDEAALVACGVDPGARAETLPIDAWRRLAAADRRSG